MTGIVNSLENLISSIFGIFQSIFETIFSAFQSVFAIIVSTFQAAFNVVSSSIHTAFSVVGTVLKDFAHLAQDLVELILGNLVIIGLTVGALFAYVAYRGQQGKPIAPTKKTA